MGGLALRAGEHLLGTSVRTGRESVVQLVIYGDYECPYTARGMRLVHELRSRFGERLVVAFRSFPLEHRHQHALAAALAAEAAAEQGRFWEMNQTLFDHQDALDEDALRSYARDLGLDEARFDEDRRSVRIGQRVRDDQRSGKELGVRSTPTFFIDGDKFDGRVSGITSLVEQQLVGAGEAASSPPDSH